MSVKRFDISGEHYEVFGDNNGEYCLYEDYSALEARCAALTAENAGLKAAIEKHADSYIMCGYCRTERDGKNDDVCEVLDSTPATDAFLAEVRAQHLQSYADSIAARMKDKSLSMRQKELLNFAWAEVKSYAAELHNAQLRKGVQS